VGTRSIVIGSVANLESLALPVERLLLIIPYRSTYHSFVTLTLALAVTPIVGRPSPRDPHSRLLFHCCDDALHTLCASTALASLFLCARCYLQPSLLRLHCSLLFVSPVVSGIICFTGAQTQRPSQVSNICWGGRSICAPALLVGVGSLCICFSGCLRMVLPTTPVINSSAMFVVAQSIFFLWFISSFVLTCTGVSV
jgi:hypothetical protein